MWIQLLYHVTCGHQADIIYTVLANRKLLCMTWVSSYGTWIIILWYSEFVWGDWGFQLWCLWSHQPLLRALLFISIRLSTAQLHRALLSWCAHAASAAWQPAARSGIKNTNTTPWNFTGKLLNTLSHGLCLQAERLTDRVSNSCWESLGF